MTTAGDWSELILAGICIGRFGWAMTRGFTRPDGLTAPMAIAASCGILTAGINLAALLGFNHQATSGSLAGIGLYLLAWLQFEGAVRAMKGNPLSFAFSSDPPACLLQRGSYRFVRHPFYSSFLLAWAAGTVATGQPLLLIPLLVMFAIYNRAADGEEAKFAVSPLAGDYAVYRARTGKFLPRFGATPGGAGGGAWRARSTGAGRETTALRGDRG
jgi:protein-S-isoprenylcysteine O-methyltransferase Ste14